MRVFVPKSVHGCFDVVHNSGTTYVLTSKSNPLLVDNSVAVSNPEGKVLVYKVRGSDVVINGTRVVPNHYDIPSCTLALTTLEKASASFVPHWCSYHQQLGVGFFFVYDNSSSDEEFEALVEASKPFPGIIFRWNYPYVSELGFTAQASQQTHTLCISRTHISRVGLIDLDEYLVLQSGTLAELLIPHAVRLQWKWVGQAGKSSLDPRDYTRSAAHTEVKQYSKLICNPIRVETATIHQCWGPGVVEVTTTAACLHHYRGLSHDTGRRCTMTDHEACRFCAVENLDLVKAYASVESEPGSRVETTTAETECQSGTELHSPDGTP
jgi:hypothetical protein